MARDIPNNNELAMGSNSSTQLFEGIVYALDSALDPSFRKVAHQSLTSQGAVRAQNLADANLVIVDSLDFEGKSSVAESVPLVTRVWLEHCIRNEKRYNFKSYSPNRSMIFSGMICTQSDLPRNDVDAISAGIEAFGGQWRHALTKDITHLFVLKPEGQKYDTAMLHKELLGIEIVLPHWFDDCYKLQRRLPTETYSFPNPTIFSPLAGLNISVPQHPSESVTARLLFVAESKEKNALYNTLLVADDQRPEKDRKNDARPWNHKRILISNDLELNADRRDAIETKIVRSGGTIVGEDQVDEADIVVAKYRFGNVYDQAIQSKKTVGSLSWLYYVEQVGKLTRPMDQLFHFPIPCVEVEGFKGYRITVTNYQGDAREYLKKLITCMGAQFTATMDQQNTHVIAAHIGGTKAERAMKWNIPVINHTWLEDCFLEWKNLPIGGVGASERYSTFPIGVNFMRLLGDKGLCGFAGVDPSKIVGNLSLREQSSPPISENGLLLPPVDHHKQLKVPVEEGSAAKVTNPANVAVGQGMLATKGILDAMEVDGAVGVLEEGEVEMMGREGGSSYPNGKQAQVERPRPRPRPKQAVKPAQSNTDARTTKPSEVLPLKNPVPLGAATTETSYPVGKRGPASRGGLGVESVSPQKAGSTAPPQPVNGGSPLRRLLSPNKNLVVEVSIPSPTRRAPLNTSKTQSPLFRRATDGASTSAISPTKSALSVGSPNLLKKNRTMSVTWAPDKSTGTDASSDDEYNAPTRTVDSKGVDHKAPPARNTASSSSHAPKSIAQPSEPFHRPRRGAATAAAAALKDAMEDVRAYEKDMKSSHGDPRRMKLGIANHLSDPAAGPSKINAKKRPRLSASDDDADNGDEGASSPKRRVSDAATHHKPSKGKQKVSNDDEEASEDLGPIKVGPPAGKSKLQGRAMKRAQEDHRVGKRSAEIESNASETPAPGGRTVSIMTTKYDLGQAELKALLKLGAKQTDNPEECTHLVTEGIYRTSKFLQALARGIFVVTPQWASQSAKQKTFMDEGPFMLKDSANEKKYNFKLADALKRAKSAAIFEGHFFYVTKKVRTDWGTLLAVIRANGGEAKRAELDVLNLMKNSKHHVISCPEDQPSWRAIRKARPDYPIYSVEIALTSAIRQEVDWDAHFCEGS